MNNRKVFCIGFHKTGTKSLAQALKVLGYRVTGPNGVEDTRISENALDMAVRLADQFDAFQDNPWPILFRQMDEAYPGSKFILSVRETENWIKSVVRYFGEKTTPMREWIYTEGSPVGHEHLYRARYNKHNKDVIEYFAKREGDLLVLDSEEDDSWGALCKFLDKPVPNEHFPHLNPAKEREPEVSLNRRHSLVGPGPLWRMKRAFQIAFLKQVGLQPEHFLLDLGCGTLRGGIPLIEYLHEQHYFGYEVRKAVLNEGKSELKESGLEYKKPTLISSKSISSLHINKEFDLIWAYSVLIHLSDEVLSNFLGAVREHLKPTGQFYTNVNIGNSEERLWQGFPVVWRSLEFYEKTGLHYGLRVTDMGTIQSLGFNSGDQQHDQQRMLRIIRDQ